MTTNDSCSCDGEGCSNCDILLGDIEFNAEFLIPEKVKALDINIQSRSAPNSQILQCS